MTVDTEQTEPATTIYIYTDGGCYYKTGVGAWAWAMCDAPDADPLITNTAYVDGTTSNRMELRAAIEALRYLLTHQVGPEGSYEKVVLTSDSQYLVNSIQYWAKAWRARGWRKSDGKEVQNSDLWEELLELVKQIEIEWKHVRGHTGNKINTLCDTMATDQMQLLYMLKSKRLA